MAGNGEKRLVAAKTTAANKDKDKKKPTSRSSRDVIQMIEGCPLFSTKRDDEVPKFYASKERPPFRAPTKHYSHGIREIKRLEKQGVISSSTKETGYLQDVVYKLSEIGKAIEKNDLTAVGSVLGSGQDTTDWVQKANISLNKLSSSPEEKTEVDTLNSSLASLVSSVAQNDVKSSKIAFVSSAAAFEKWTSLTGLVGKLKGL